MESPRVHDGDKIVDIKETTCDMKRRRRRIALVANSLCHQGPKLTACLSKARSSAQMVLDRWW